MGFDDCNRPEAFSNLVRGGRRGWTVMNALDGLDEEQRRFVYAGYSAGPCVLAPSLAGLDLCDSPEDCQATYGDVRFDGLGILDRPVVPHLSSPGHPETQLLSQVAARYEADDQPYWPLSDGQALVIDGTSARIFGD